MGFRSGPLAVQHAGQLGPARGLVQQGNAGAGAAIRHLFRHQKMSVRPGRDLR